MIILQSKIFPEPFWEVLFFAIQALFNRKTDKQQKTYYNNYVRP